MYVWKGVIGVVVPVGFNQFL